MLLENFTPIIFKGSFFRPIYGKFIGKILYYKLLDNHTKF